jgi:hypothetical protein
VEHAVTATGIFFFLSLSLSFDEPMNFEFGKLIVAVRAGGLVGSGFKPLTLVLLAFSLSKLYILYTLVAGCLAVSLDFRLQCFLAFCSFFRFGV